MCVGVCTGRRGGSQSRSARGPADDDTTTGGRTTPPHSLKSRIQRGTFVRIPRRNPSPLGAPFSHPDLPPITSTLASRAINSAHRLHPPLTPHYRTSPSPADTPYHTGPTGDAAHPHFHPSSPDHSSPHRGYPQNLPHSLPALPATCCGGYAGPITKGSDSGFSRAREGGGDDGRVRRARAGYAVARFCR